MPSLEQLVRPFAKPTPLATRRVFGINANVAPEEVIIAWGVAGTMPTPTKEDDGQVGFKVENCNDTFKEKNRKTHDQTISDPNSGSSVTFTITDNIVFSKDPADASNVGSLRTETTSFSVPDIFAGTPFGDVSASQQCSSSYTLNNKQS